MEKLNAEELIAKILDQMTYSEFANSSEEHLSEVISNCVCVDDVGGYEGDGEHTQKVYHFIDHNIYLMIQGRYMSQCGTEWHRKIQEVIPKTVEVIVYEAV